MEMCTHTHTRTHKCLIIGWHSLKQSVRTEGKLWSCVVCMCVASVVRGGTSREEFWLSLLNFVRNQCSVYRNQCRRRVWGSVWEWVGLRQCVHITVTWTSVPHSGLPTALAPSKHVRDTKNQIVALRRDNRKYEGRERAWEKSMWSGKPIQSHRG